MQSDQPQVTPERIYQFAWSYVPTLVLEAAIRNRIFDVLDDGPKPVSEIAKLTGASHRGVSAIVNVLAGLQLLDKRPDGNVALTPESATFLVSAKPSFQGGILRHTSEHLIPKWLKLTDIVRTGKPETGVNNEGAGAAFFQSFVTDIFPMSYPSAQALAKALPLNANGPARVLDLAAGSGVWGIALAQASDSVRVTAVDWADVISVTKKMAGRFGLADRFEFVEGNLVSADFGGGYQVATLGHILHSLGPDDSRAVLKKTFAALASGGTIAIAEFLVNADRSGPMQPLFFAVNMLVNTETGDTFSFEEIAGWLAEAGFVNTRTLNAPGPSPLILATKP